MLLRHLKWNKEKLIEKYMDNASKVLVDAGVNPPEAPQPPAPIRTSDSTSSQTSSRRSTRGTRILGLSSRSPAISPNPLPLLLKRAPSKKVESFVCQICFNDEPNLQTLALDCDHAFCKDCWNDYTIPKIKDESEHAIRCMAEGCALLSPDSFIRDLLLPAPGALVGDPEKEALNAKAWTRFQELLVRHYVGCNKNLKFCPYPSCTNTVSCPSAASKSSLATIVPSVSCGARGIGSGQEMTRSQQLGRGLQGKEHKFCFGCPIESDHRPVICAVAKMWLKKCRDDSETANWIKSNTKECSHCQSTIEKNGGCK